MKLLYTRTHFNSIDKSVHKRFSFPKCLDCVYYLVSGYDMTTFVLCSLARPRLPEHIMQFRPTLQSGSGGRAFTHDCQ